MAALTDLSGWIEPFSGLSTGTRSDRLCDAEANRFLDEQVSDFFAAFVLRAELEARAGGNPSWNTDVDYRDASHFPSTTPRCANWTTRPA